MKIKYILIAIIVLSVIAAAVFFKWGSDGSAIVEVEANQFTCTNEALMAMKNEEQRIRLASACAHRVPYVYGEKKAWKVK